VLHVLRILLGLVCAVLCPDNADADADDVCDPG
jgi:hypothetical protein